MTMSCKAIIIPFLHGLTIFNTTTGITFTVYGSLIYSHIISGAVLSLAYGICLLISSITTLVSIKNWILNQYCLRLTAYLSLCLSIWYLTWGFYVIFGKDTLFNTLSDNKDDLRLSEDFITRLESGYIVLACISFTLFVLETLKFLMFFHYGSGYIEEQIMSSLKDPLIVEEGTEGTTQQDGTDFASLSASSDPLWWARSEQQPESSEHDEWVEDGVRPPWVSLG